jgi:hypothetical protein
MRSSIATIVVLTLVVAASVSQAQHSDDPFSRVPSSRRTQLKLRLSEFVSYHVSKDWGHVYDLLSDRYKADQAITTKEVFLEKRLYSQLKRFTPAYAYKLKDDSWWVRGCATNGREAIDSLVEAHYTNHNWYFSDFSRFPMGCIECEELQCKP